MNESRIDWMAWTIGLGVGAIFAMSMAIMWRLGELAR